MQENVFGFIGMSIVNENGLHLNENILSAFSHRAKSFLVDKLNELIEEKKILRVGKKLIQVIETLSVQMKKFYGLR